MEATVCDEHSLALASAVNVVETVAPLAGAVTVIPFALFAGGADDCAVMATSLAQPAPPLPHDLT